MFVFFVILFLLIEPSNAHQGRVASDGCHYCRTNCEKYNLTANTRHGHSKATHCDPSKGPVDPLFISDGPLTAPVYTTEQTSTYNRKDWPHWIDEDNDCQNTRHEILISRSKETPSFDMKGCTVVSGKWDDFYFNEILEVAKFVDIDHVVSLKEAHETGGSAWSTEKRRQFANDSENLVITNRKYNRHKGAQTPLTWAPINKEYACRYYQKWIHIKKKYELQIDPKVIDYYRTMKCDLK